MFFACMGMSRLFLIEIFLAVDLVAPASWNSKCDATTQLCCWVNVTIVLLFVPDLLGTNYHLMDCFYHDLARDTR